MKNRIIVILVSLVIMVYSFMPFSTTNNKNIKEFQANKIEVNDEIVVGIQPKVEIQETRFRHDIAVEKMLEEIKEIDNITDKKDWFIVYKNIIEKYSYIIESPETIYDCFTKEELDLLFRVVQAEIGDEYSFEQKVNVSNVIFNRLEHEKFSDEINDILVADQFQSIENQRYKEVKVSEDTILACEYAFMFPDTTNGSLFFDSNNVLKYEFVMNDGAHNFYKLKGEN